MDRAVYERMAAQEAEHWWFAGRRAVLRALLGQLQLKSDTRILEAGCGSGGNLEMLAEFGDLQAFEFDADARLVAEARGVAPVVSGSLPDDVPEGAFDLIALLDVLEHIAEDRPALEALAERLAPSGQVLVTVPAGPWLWSHHDVAHHHHRRYTRAGLVDVIDAAGLVVTRIGHYNSLLFPLAVAQRMAQKLTGSDAPTDAQPAPWLNTVLRSVFSAERYLVGRVPMPVGLSLWAVARPKS